MKISRVGSSANHGKSYIELKSPKFKWNEKTELLEVRQTRISDFSTDSRHDYTIEISLPEICELLKVLGNNIPSENPELLARELSPCLREIIRLEKACIGNIGSFGTIVNN